MITTALVRPFQSFMLNRMTELKNYLINQAEEFLGRKITYSSIGPSLFKTLDIRNIQIYGEDLSPIMTIARLSVSYTLINLIRGDIAKSLRSIRIDRPVIALDRERDGDIIGRFSIPAAGAERAVFPMPSEIRIADFLSGEVHIRVRNGLCEITGGNDLFKVRDLFLNASRSRGTFHFQGRWNAEASLTKLFSESVGASMSLRFSGECASDFQSGNAVLQIGSLSGDLFQIRPITVNLSLMDNRIELRKINDPAPFDFSAEYDFGSGRLSGVFRCEDFSIQQLLTVSCPLKDYNQWLAFKISGRASFVQSPEQGLQYRLDFAGVFPLDMVPVDNASFVISGEGDKEYIEFTELSVQINRGIVRYQGSLAFDPEDLIIPISTNGILSFSDFSIPGRDASTINIVNGNLTLRTQDGSIDFWGETPLNIGGVPLSEVQGSILREEGGFTFRVSLMRFEAVDPAEEDPIPRGISLEGFFDYDPQYLELRIALNAFPVADILDMARPFKSIPNPYDFVQTQGGKAINPFSINTITINTEIFMATDFTHLSYNVPGLVITQGEKGAVFTGGISGTDQHFALHQSRIRLVEPDTHTETTINLLASANFMDLEDISFSLEAAYMDKPYRLEGVIFDRRSISIQGSYGLRAYISMTDLGGYSGYIEVENIPIPYRGQVARFSLMASLHYDSPEWWSLIIDRFEIADILIARSSEALFHLAGWADQKGASFPDILIDNGQNPLRGTISLFWDTDFSNITGTLNMGDETGNELYNLEGSFKKKHLELRLWGSNMRIGRFLEKSFDTVISGKIQVDWDSLDSFSVKVHIFSLSAMISDKDIHLTGFASLNAKSLILEALQIDYGGFQATIPLVRVDRLQSRGEIKSRIQSNSPDRDIDFFFTLGFDFKPIDSWFELPEAASAFDGVLTIDTAHFNTLKSEEPFSFIFSRNNSRVSLSGGPQDMIRFQISDEGDFYGELSSPSPIRGTVIGFLGTKTIDARSSNLYVDLTSLWRFIPVEAKNIINITGGFVTASVQIAGPLGDPEFFGSAQGNSVRLEVPQYLVQEIRPVPITITLNGNEMSFGPIPAAVGSGRGTIAGFFRFDRWIPDTFDLDIRVPQSSPIPFGFDIIGIMARGDASGILKISLANLILTVTGDLTAHNTGITLNTKKLPDLQTMKSNSTSQPVITDITIRAGRKVEFIWPIIEFPILQAFAAMGTTLKINSNTLTNRYSLIGDVSLQSGEIFYFERNFYIREGTLSFNENEFFFDPRISARAEIRDQIDEGPVTISMIIDNAPLQSFTARFESSPPLSQMEIFSLLGQGITGTPTSTGEGNETVQNAFLSSATDILAQTQLFRRFQRKVQDIFALDMFTFRTQILQNMVLLAAGQNQNKVDINNRIGNYFDNTSVFIGKYITGDMFFQGMLSLRYGEDSNAPFSGLTWGGGYAVEPDFGLELRGPFFDMRVNIAPFSFQVTRISDISFTLTRRKSTFKEMFLPFLH